MVNTMCLLGINIKQSIVDFGPQEIRLAGIFGPSYKIMWDQAPSCYNIQGFQFVVLKGMHDYLSCNLIENDEIALFLSIYRSLINYSIFIFYS